MPTDYRRSHLGRRKAESYHGLFRENSYRRMMWQLERGLLDRIVGTLPRPDHAAHLDFACGTGRILTHFEQNDGISSVGVDVSPDMLEEAKLHVKRSQLIEADLTRHDALGNRKFDLITAFRFFPNAQPELRQSAMQLLASHLADDGLFVFNNHMNSASLTNRIRRLTRCDSQPGMAMAEVDSLVNDCGLKIAQIFALGVFPSTECHILMPTKLLGIIEKLLSSCTAVQGLAQNHIFLCHRA